MTIADININGHTYTDAMWRADAEATLSGVGNDIASIIGALANSEGTLTKAITGGVTLSGPESVNIGFIFTGPLSGDAAILFAAGFKGPALVKNATTGGHIVVVYNNTPAGFALVYSGETVLCFSDGTDFVRIAPFDLHPTISLIPTAPLNPVLAITRTTTDPAGTQRSLMNLVAYGKGDNATVEGVLCLFAQATDEGSVNSSTKGTLYGVDAAVYPIVDRNNPPNDDAVCGVFSNIGTAKATSAIYCGHGRQGGGEDFNAIVEIESWGTWGILFDGTIDYGIDFHYGNQTNAAMRLKNATQIVGRKADNSIDLRIIEFDSSNNVLLGASLIAYADGSIGAVGNTAPTSDNAMTLGTSMARWSEVWAANGTIQTSDPKLKTDIQNLPISLPIINAVDPKTFKWKQGGMISAKVQTEETMPITQRIKRNEFKIIEQDGKFIRTLVEITEDEPVFDLVQVFNEDGSPAVRIFPKKEEQKDQLGNIIFPMQPERKELVYHKVMKTEKRLVTKDTLVPRAGNRTHWGFLASDIQKAIIEFGGGRDFGGYVKDQDGGENLRPDQLIPILWKSIQELSSKIDEFEKRLK